MIKRDACRGCHNDFYNHPGHALDGKRCWSAKTGTMVTRYKIGTHTLPTIKGAFTKVKVPSCFTQPGQYAYYSSLPDFVKAPDLNRTKRAS